MRSGCVLEIWSCGHKKRGLSAEEGVEMREGMMEIGSWVNGGGGCVAWPARM